MEKEHWREISLYRPARDFKYSISPRTTVYQIVRLTASRACRRLPNTATSTRLLPQKREYHQQAIKRHYRGELRGLAQRGLRGVKLGRANRGRRLDAAERQAKVIEAKAIDD